MADAQTKVHWWTLKTFEGVRGHLLVHHKSIKTREAVGSEAVWGKWARQRVRSTPQHTQKADMGSEKK